MKSDVKCLHVSEGITLGMVDEGKKEEEGKGEMYFVMSFFSSGERKTERGMRSG